jgi:hypothetical protein
MVFKIKIETEAYDDIQEGIVWYNQQKAGLGIKFHKEVKEFLEVLKTNPFFQIRYKNTRCLPLKKFPFMIHFTIDEENSIVTIRAIFHTSQNPKIWKGQ